MPESKRRQSFASQLIGLGGSHPDPDVLKERIADRAQREAADTRTEIEKLLGVPPPDRSALAQSSGAKPKSDQVF